MGFNFVAIKDLEVNRLSHTEIRSARGEEVIAVAELGVSDD